MIKNIRTYGRRFLTLSLVLGAVWGVSDVAYADEEDQDRARAAMLRGEVEPLPKALDVIEKNFQGDIIEVELEEEDKFGIGPTFIYEMKLLTPEGRVLKLKLHAKSLEILTVEGNDTDESETYYKD